MGYIVRYSAFLKIVELLRTFGGYSSFDDKVVHVIFEALDDDGNGVLTSTEFVDMCDVLQHKFAITKRDSCIFAKTAGSSFHGFLKECMENGTDGPDFGYGCRFMDSPFDVFMNCVLASNVVWIILQSIYDLNDIPEADWFSYLDTFFCLVYLLEVTMKLCRWSWEEYWKYIDNRFDFVTTLILVGAALVVLFSNISRTVLRNVNMLRLVRLLKALNNIPAYQRTFMVISRMISTCLDVLLMNFLIIYLWSALGVQLFGGQLVEDNPRLAGKGLDYFDSHFEVYNFNDMPSGMVTLFFFMITNWVDQIATVCMALAPEFSPFWFVTCAFLLSFYVLSPLLAFNVFTAFSIDVYCKLQEFADKEEQGEKSEIEKNIEKIKIQLAEQGFCLHCEESAEMSRARVYREMFQDDDAHSSGAGGESGEGAEGGEGEKE